MEGDKKEKEKRGRKGRSTTARGGRTGVNKDRGKEKGQRRRKKEG